MPSPHVPPPVGPDAALPSALIERFDTPGPRYTSYPTANRFDSAFGPAHALRALVQRGHTARRSMPLSLYVHVPFCESLCYYCACNKIVTRRHDRAGPYLESLDQEVQLVAAALGGRAPVSQVHLGGGSPTFLNDAELERLTDLLHRAFDIVPGAEMSIEVDPRTVTPARLAFIRRLGFQRISFGVQDFDPAVQEAVHRVQSLGMVRELIDCARRLGYESINTDLIYGLPMQTVDRFARTVAQTAALQPDRIALYAYAHLPDRFKPQRRIDAGDLPPAAARVSMLRGAIGTLLGAGYHYIGMDHFALADDGLARAQREGRLHRNFQGYSTHAPGHAGDEAEDGDLIGLGVSAISRVGPCYYQNAKTLAEYDEALARGELPVVAGIALNCEDRLRRDVIMALMCHGRVDFATIEARYGVVVPTHFAAELERLEQLAEAGLVEMASDAIQVTPAGRYLVRAVAMVFDQHLHANPAPGRFSRIV